jgi:hypothetical protein
MPTVTFFPVDNGDMSLIVLESGHTILVDINIRELDDGMRDVETDLRDRLSEDAEGRPYVDAFLLSHPDEDHCRGLVKTFHLGKLSEYPTPPRGERKKIVIREMWSSPMIFRRASKDHPLCDDAKAWNAEARRRVALFRENGSVGTGNGDRILILGEDENGKTDDLTAILVRVNEAFNKVNGSGDSSINVRLLAPHPVGSDEEEELRSKNHSSVITQMSIRASAKADACLLLTGGDAEVAIWDKQWEEHGDAPVWLQYDIMLTPHHCSWHTLSYDSWSELGEDAEVSDPAKNALCQGRGGAFIVASSKVIEDDDDDPPCIRAEREYKEMVQEFNGRFMNTATFPRESDPEPMEFEIKPDGPRLKEKKSAAGTAGAIGAAPIIHG